MKTWLVWLVEYQDEGSFEIRARTHWEAKRKFRGDDDCGPLQACLLTPILRKARRASAK